MPIKVVCPSCGRTLNARDEHAGRKLKCPACAAAVSVPAAAPDAPQELDDLVESEPAPPRGRGSASRRDDYDDRDDDRDNRDSNRNRRDRDRDDDGDYDRPRRNPGPSPFVRQGLSNMGTILMFCGVGMLVLLLICVFFPWRGAGVSVGMGDFGGPGMDFGRAMSISATKSGITDWRGIISFILAILAIAFVMVALFVLNQGLFKISLWTAFGVSLVCAILAMLAAVLKETPPGLEIFGKMGKDVGISASIGGAWGAWVAMIVGVIAAGLFIATVLTMRSEGAPRPRRAPVDDED
jgi:hypothetical protein